ncbi:hypothetical protein N9948_00040 [bacterium]|nr:hypothetical protein [bacterium]
MAKFFIKPIYKDSNLEDILSARKYYSYHSKDFKKELEDLLEEKLDANLFKEFQRCWRKEEYLIKNLEESHSYRFYLKGTKSLSRHCSRRYVRFVFKNESVTENNIKEGLLCPSVKNQGNIWQVCYGKFNCWYDLKSIRFVGYKTSLPLEKEIGDIMKEHLRG